jgi:hypothetical protein
VIVRSLFIANAQPGGTDSTRRRSECPARARSLNRTLAPPALRIARSASARFHLALSRTRPAEQSVRDWENVSFVQGCQTVHTLTSSRRKCANYLVVLRRVYLRNREVEGDCIKPQNHQRHKRRRASSRSCDLNHNFAVRQSYGLFPIIPVGCASSSLC